MLEWKNHGELIAGSQRWSMADTAAAGGVDQSRLLDRLDSSCPEIDFQWFFRWIQDVFSGLLTRINLKIILLIPLRWRGYIDCFVYVDGLCGGM